MKSKVWRLEARVFATVESDRALTQAEAEGAIYEILLNAVQEELDEKGGDVSIDILEPVKQAKLTR